MSETKRSPLKKWEAVQTRPGMYFGGTEFHGLHQAIWCVIDDLAKHIFALTPMPLLQISIEDDFTLAINTTIKIHPNDFFALIDTSTIWYKQKSLHIWMAVAASSLCEISISGLSNQVANIYFVDGQVQQIIGVEGVATASRYAFCMRITFSRQVFDQSEAISYFELLGRIKHLCTTRQKLDVQLNDER